MNIEIKIRTDDPQVAARVLRYAAEYIATNYADRKGYIYETVPLVYGHSDVGDLHTEQEDEPCDS